MDAWRVAVRRVIGPTAVLAAALFAYHIVLRHAMRRSGLRLGAVSPRFAPLYAYQRLHQTAWAVPMVLAWIGAIVLFRRRIAAGAWSDPHRLAAWTAAFLALALAGAMTGGGPRAIARPYRRTKLEYIGAVPLVHDLRSFIGHYAEHTAELPMHARTKPPGGVVMLWLVGRWIGPGPVPAALGTIVFTGLTVPAVWLLARDLAGPRAARYAIGLYALMPNVLMFTATSMDGPFAVWIVGALVLFWHARQRRSRAWAAAAGLTWTVAMFFTFSAVFVPVFAAAVAGLTAARDRDRLADTLRVLAWAAAASGAASLVLWLATGYSPLAMLHANLEQHRTIMAGMDGATAARAIHLSVANLAAFLIGSGVAVVTAWAGAAARAVRGQAPVALAVFVPSFILALLAIDLAPLYTLETERIWIFLAPCLAVPAAHGLVAACPPSLTTERGFVLVAGLLAVQTVAGEMFLNTYW